MKVEKNVIQAAWEEYHGPIIEEDGERYIPAMPPTFMRGFVDGYQHAERVLGQKKKSRKKP